MKNTKSGVKHALIIPDTHIPFHDKRAYKLMLQVAKNAVPKLNGVYILGDFGEFASVSSHPKDPDIESRFSKELEAVNAHLDELDELFPEAEKVFIEGNHEYRFSRFLRDKAPQLFEVTNAKSLLKMDDRGWKWIPYGPNQKVKVLGSKLYARHEPTSGGEHVAAGTVKKSGASVIFGHVHKIQEHQTVMLNGDNHRGITCGWLGDKNHKVFNYTQSHNQWALGFAIVTVLPDGTFFSQTLHIINYQVVYGGKVYRG